MHDDHVGQRLKTYTFSRKLGEGAWARVYEVYDEKTRSQVACTQFVTQARLSRSG